MTHVTPEQEARIREIVREEIAKAAPALIKAATARSAGLNRRGQ